MRLHGKKLLMIIRDGVEQTELEQLKAGFEEEKAVIFLTTPQEFLSVQTVYQGRAGKEIMVDLPFEAAESTQFDGLIIPDGLLSVELLRKDVRVINLIFLFHQQRLPIFASGTAVQLLYDSQVLSNQVLVREGTPMQSFLDQAVSILLEAAPIGHLYRPTM